MPWTSKKLIDSYTIIAEVKNVIANAERLGEHEYAEQAKLRLRKLQGIDDKEFAEQFERIIREYEEFLSEKNGRKTVATYTRRAVKSDGFVETMVRWALTEPPADGFLSLVEAEKGHLTAEFLICQFRHYFAANVIEAAERRLLRHKVTPPE